MEESVKEIVDFFAGVHGPFCLYPNPMRGDGVFIGQKAEIKPYPNVRSMSGLLYPATPQGVKKYPIQLPHDLASKVLEALNARKE